MLIYFYSFKVISFIFSSSDLDEFVAECGFFFFQQGNKVLMHVSSQDLV